MPELPIDEPDLLLVTDANRGPAQESAMQPWNAEHLAGNCAGACFGVAWAGRLTQVLSGGDFEDRPFFHRFREADGKLPVFAIAEPPKGCRLQQCLPDLHLGRLQRRVPIEPQFAEFAVHDFQIPAEFRLVARERKTLLDRWASDESASRAAIARRTHQQFEFRPGRA